VKVQHNILIHAAHARQQFHEVRRVRALNQRKSIGGWRWKCARNGGRSPRSFWLWRRLNLRICHQLRERDVVINHIAICLNDKSRQHASSVVDDRRRMANDDDEHSLALPSSGYDSIVAWMRRAADCKQRPLPLLLVSGSVGSGKSIAVAQAAAAVGLDVTSIGSDTTEYVPSTKKAVTATRSAPALRNAASLQRWLAIVKTRTFTPTVLVIDDAEAIFGGVGGGGDDDDEMATNADAKLIELGKHQMPVVIIAADTYSSRVLRALWARKKYTEHVKLRRPSTAAVTTYLSSRKRFALVPRPRIAECARACDGDLRRTRLALDASDDALYFERGRLATEADTIIWKKLDALLGVGHTRMPAAFTRKTDKAPESTEQQARALTLVQEARGFTLTQEARAFALTQEARAALLENDAESLTRHLHTHYPNATSNLEALAAIADICAEASSLRRHDADDDDALAHYHDALMFEMLPATLHAAQRRDGDAPTSLSYAAGDKDAIRTKLEKLPAELEMFELGTLAAQDRLDECTLAVGVKRARETARTLSSRLRRHSDVLSFCTSLANVPKKGALATPEEQLVALKRLTAKLPVRKDEEPALLVLDK
jgi:hypothetical protein